jgi:CHAT domain-containing protein
LFRDGNYTEAEAQSQQLIAAALRAGDTRTATRATGNLGGILFALHQYRASLVALLEARRTAIATADFSESASIDANLCSLYLEMGDLDQAARRMRGTLENMAGNERVEHLAQTQILLAILRARQRRMTEALPLFQQGIEGAEARGDWKLAAYAWNRIGEEYLKQGDLRRAEPPLLEAYRIRGLRSLPLDTSYRNLGRLRLEQGDLPGAEEFLNRAVALTSQPRGPIPSWDIYHYRGRLRLAQGRLPEAISDLRTAVRLARAWRWSTPPDDDVRIGAEGWLDRVYSALIDAGNRLFQQTGDISLVRETFEAAEENSAHSLRTLIQGRVAAEEALPVSYWPAVTRAQRAEVEATRLRTPAAEQEALSSRAALAQIESAAFGAPPPGPAGLLARVQSELGPEDALIAFHMGDSASWVWAVDRNLIAVYALPPRERVNSLAAAFSGAVRDGLPEAASAGAALYRTLFAPLAAEFRNKRRWLLALDAGDLYRPGLDALFHVPFAALSDGTPSSAMRVTEIIPGAAMWSNRSAHAFSGLLLGVGDAIYNPADPRWGKPPRQGSGARSLPPLSSLASLPRLVASASELDACARAWNGGNLLLEGPSASRSALAASLQRDPDVIHFATHFVESADPHPHGAIVLSLNAQGAAETIEPAEISSWRVNTQLVVLSGCRSSAGPVLPGSGMFGLTRAWLAAGAHNVLASHWDVPDDGGPLFASFYRHLSQLGQTPASALRAAQMEMAASPGWRANASYWAAYFVVGRE